MAKLMLMRIVSLVLLILASIGSAHAEKRVALVIGNSAYRETTPLANPLNDARDISAALASTGFKVIEAFDADKRKIDTALRTFAEALASADVALFYYAGHGLQIGLQNFLIPVDAKVERERDLEFEAVKLDFVLRQMEIDREGKTTIVILDACRDNPMSRNLARSMGTRSTSIGKGLAAASTGLGTFIAYSTQPGNVALDGEGRNSPFTAALVKHLPVKGRNLPAMMIEVRKDVVAATGGRQVPWDHSALTGEFYFIPGDGAPPAPSAAAVPPASPTPSEIAALQERLRRLEEESKKGAPAANPAPTTASPPAVANLPPVTAKRQPRDPQAFTLTDNVRIDGLLTSDQRQPNPEACRDSCERESGCVAFQHGRRAPVMGQCQLFSRVDARQEDPHWRSGIRTSALPPSEAANAPARRLSYEIKERPARREQGFQIYDGLSVMGDPIKMGTADTAAGCQTICRNTPGCLVAVYNEFFRGKNVACQLYRDITNTMRSPSSTMSVRSE